RVVVMDFGIARDGAEALGPSVGPKLSPVDTMEGLTQLGSIVGTPLYMSPEQAQGLPVDARSDLFTLGVIFYELLTANLPFLGRSVNESLRKRCTEPAIPPVALNPEIPKALNEIVLKCLQTRPEDRYPRA